MSKIQVNEIVNHFDTGAPDCPKGLTVTGFSTFTGSSSFSGDVSIGGTLTYEDVTNIDSVGVITARGGLNVGVGGTILTTTTAGRIGIGTDSPDSLLTLNATSNPGIRIKSSGTIRSSLFADTGSIQTTLASYEGYPLVFSVSAGGGTAERLRINSTGKIGIGTTGSSDPNDGITLVQNDNIRWVSSAGNLRQAIRCTAADSIDFYTGTNTLAASINSLANLDLGGGSCFAAGATNGDFSVDISGLRQVAGGAWRQAGVFVYYTGIDGNQSNSTTIISSVRLRGLSTWNDVSKSDIVGTLSVTLSNASNNGCTLNFNVSDSNLGSVILILNAGSGTNGFPNMTING